MTTLVAIVAVCIATNVTTEIGKPCGGCAMLGTLLVGGPPVVAGHRVDCPEQSLSRDTKLETTEIVETKTLRFIWEDEERVMTKTRLLSRNVRRWTRREDWVEEGGK